MTALWKPPRHGEKSRYIHVRLRSPTRFSILRTRSIGHGCKQVYGHDTKTKKWVAQNVMIPKSAVQIEGKGIFVKNRTIAKKLDALGISADYITRMSSGGISDYKYPVYKIRGAP